MSFIDRLLDCIKAKIKAKMSINKSIIHGKTEYEKYDQEIQCAQSVITKFKENFFIAEVMEPKKLGEETKMNETFYTKQGIDFLYFARPGTAYGP